MSSPEPELEQGGAAALYQGDAGELPAETRRVLVQLLSGPSIDGRRHGKLWPALIRDEQLVRSRLSDLFLELVIDRDAQVAFTRQADTGELDAPILLRRTQLTFLDSTLLLLLRQRLTEADSLGDRAVITTEDISAHLAFFERAANTDKAGFARRSAAALKKMTQQSILLKIRGAEDRYEIAPALKLLFSPETIRELGAVYSRIAVGEPLIAAAEEDDE